MASVEAQLKDLSLSIEEDDRFDCEAVTDENVDECVKLALVGRFLTDFQINFWGYECPNGEYLGPGKGLLVKDLGSNLYFFQFYHAVDMQRILEGGQWSFDNNLLILEKLTAGDRVFTVPLFNVPMWVQIYDLPVGLMTERVGKMMGDFIGTFMEYDARNAAVRNSYFRIRVLLDVRLPLKRAKKIKKAGGEVDLVKV